jgi:hypothetical protein
MCRHEDGYACEEHKSLIKNNEDDEYFTEADYQTWMRLY